MSTDAVVMMVLAMVLVWGGLGLALVNLRRGQLLDEPFEGEWTPRDL